MRYLAMLLLLVAGMTFIGCGEGDAENAGKEVDKAVEGAGDKMEEAGDAIKEGAEEVGEEIEEATE